MRTPEQSVRAARGTRRCRPKKCLDSVMGWLEVDGRAGPRTWAALWR